MRPDDIAEPFACACRGLLFRFTWVGRLQRIAPGPDITGLTRTEDRITSHETKTVAKAISSRHGLLHGNAMGQVRLQKDREIDAKTDI